MKIVFVVLLVLLLTGCARKNEEPANDIDFANGTKIDTTSKDQVYKLAEIFFKAQGQDMVKPNETAQQSLAMLEQLAKGQGSGEITVFFEDGVSNLPVDSLEYERLVRFLDYLAMNAHGRKVLFVSIGSASAYGEKQRNHRLAESRAKAPIQVIKKYLVNIPHDFYKIYAVADLSSQANIPIAEQREYQHTRIIAVFEAAQLQQFPAQKVQVKKLTAH